MVVLLLIIVIAINININTIISFCYYSDISILLPSPRVFCVNLSPSVLEV